MNIAVASPSSSAYSETFVLMQMERLPCRLRIHGGPIASETIPGGPILPLRHARGIIDTALELSLHRKSPWAGAQRRELKRRLIKSEIQALLANYGPTGVALLPVCLDLKIPLVVHFHGYDAHRADIVAHHREAYQTLGRSAHAIIGVSEVMIQTLRSFGIPAEKLHLLRCGCDADRFVPKTKFPKDPVFFGAGRFVDKKAPYLTVLAFKKVLEQIPTAKLVLGGDGVLMEATQNIVQGLGIADAVELPGALTHEQVAHWMQAATAFVQHSLTPILGPSSGDREGTPVAVMEAMVSGLPVIATRHAGIGEVIEHGKTGLLVKERDVQGMADAMLHLARNLDQAQALGLAAREHALKYYTGKNYIESLMAIIGAQPAGSVR